MIEKILLSLDSSTIVALASILASVIITCVQSRSGYRIHREDLRHDIKKRGLDLEYKRKYEAYKCFIQIVNSGAPSLTYKEKQNLDSAFHMCVLVCDSDTLTLLNEYESCRTSGQSVSDELLMKICTSFNRELTKVSSMTSH